MLWVFADLVRVAFFFECTPAFLRAVLQGRAWAWCFLGTGHVACGMWHVGNVHILRVWTG